MTKIVTEKEVDMHVFRNRCELIYEIERERKPTLDLSLHLMLWLKFVIVAGVVNQLVVHLVLGYPTRIRQI